MKRRIHFLVLTFLFTSGNLFAQFITTWQTDNPGTSNNDQITIPTIGGGYSYAVSWEEVGNPANFGVEPGGQTGDYTITFPSPGTYEVVISGAFPRIYFNGGGDRLKILTIVNWGPDPWTSMANAFMGCENLTSISGFPYPDLSVVTDMSGMFQGAIMLNSSLDGWDVSNVTNMQNMFAGCTAYNQSMNLWDVSNVSSMSGMFDGATNFNGDITDWNVSSVTDFSSMFRQATSFNRYLNNWLINITPGANINMASMFEGAVLYNQDMNNWQMDEVIDMNAMFKNAAVFDGKVENWNVSQVTNMSELFMNAQAFNRDINAWDVSIVGTMASMFEGASAFNRDLDGWDALLGNVLTMDNMFKSAVSFNGNIGGWDVGGVLSMFGMFEGATLFNQSLASWSVSGVTDMRNMFLNASNFNQSLATWDISGVSSLDNMLSITNLSSSNYDATLIAWEALPPPIGIDLDAFGVSSCTAGAAIASLTGPFGWTILDGGVNCGPPPATPSNLFTTEVSDSQIDLSWVDNATDETGYTIERREGNTSNFVAIGSAGVDATSYSDITVSSEMGYFYRVIATGVAEDSGPSNEKFGSTITPSGYALDFDGSDDIVAIADDPDFQFGTGDFTIEAWIYYDGTDQAAAIVGKRNPNPPFEQVQLRIGTGLNQPAGKTVEAYVLPDTRFTSPVEQPEDRIVTDATDLTVGWHHIAMVEDWDTDLRLYVDGVQVGIDTDSHLGKPVNIAGQPLNIGNFGAGNTFDGIIDEVRIWSTARTMADIQSDMFVTLAGNEPNLIAYYRFDQGIPNEDNTSPPIAILPDRSTNNHDGVVTNFTLDGTTSNWVRSAAIPRPFITTWQTDNSGSTNDDQIRIPTVGGGYNYNIYWEEVGNPGNNGTEPPGQTGNYEITFPSPGTYRVEISGDFPRIYFNNTGDDKKILSVEQWGSIAWTSMAAAFDGCANMHVYATDAPDLSSVTSMSEMFRDCEIMNEDINHWDVSNVTNMSDMFWDALVFNQPLDNWDVSSVNDMSNMFFFAREFNQYIGNWDVSNVSNMNLMFASANVFNQDIGSWDVQNVFNMNQMFSNANKFNQDISGWVTTSLTEVASMFNDAWEFNQDISGWDISGISNMTNFFGDARSFDQDLSGWDVSGVTDMERMFSGTNSFTADITGWDVSNVVFMRSMFENNTTFNQDISGWNVSSVVDMNGMFEGAIAFNQPIGAWTTTNLNDTRSMFSGASSFDQDLGGWDLNTTNLMVNMFNNSGMSVGNYDLTLIGWESQTLQNNVNFGAVNVFYCSASTERANIISTYGWTINDGGPACIKVYEGTTITDPEIANGQATPIDVGSAAFGGTRTKSITIENLLAVDLTTLNIAITGGSFTPLAPPVTITVGSNVVVNIELGGGIGVFTETVSITAAEFSDPFVFPITGEVTAGPEPEIAVYEGDDVTGNVILDGQVVGYSLGNEDRGSDATESITIENKGSSGLNISDIFFTGTDFSVTEVFPIFIPVDGTYTVDITLSGAVAGFFLDQVTIVSDDSDEDMFDFPVYGTINGPEIRVYDGPDRFFPNPQVNNGQVTPIDFGVGNVPSVIVRPITIANWGRVDLDVSSISISGTNYTATLSTPVTIDAEIDGVISTVTFDITLNGTATGLIGETVTINSDDDANPVLTFDLVGVIEGPSPPPHIYWTENIGDALGGDDEIHRTDLDGNDLHRYYQGFSAEIAGLEMDTANNRLYWTDAARAEIIYGDIGPNGLSSGPTVILDFNPSGTNDLEDLALDEPNGHIYFTHGNAETGFTNKIARVDTDGSNYTELIDLGGEEPFGIDLDLANGKVYFTTNELSTGLAARLYRMNLNGTGLEELYAEGSSFPYTYYRDVKIDPVNEIVYWSVGEEDLPGGSIYYNDMNEAASFTSPTTFSFPGEPRGIDIDLFNDKLYWVCRGANDGATRPMIMRSNLDGSTIENIFTMAIYPDSYPPGPPGSAHLALDLSGLAEPEIQVFVGPDNSGTELFTGQPASVNVGSTLIGNDLTQTFTIENTGTASLVITGSTVNGPTFSIFGADGTLPPGASSTFDVVLSGAAEGSFSDAVSLQTNDTDELVFTFPITGDVLASSTGEINLLLDTTPITDGQAAAIDMGSAPIGTDIDTTFTIENTGLADLIISSVVLSCGEYAIVGTAPTTIPVGSSASLTIRLSGAAAGTFPCSLTINNDDPDEGTFTFNLTGTILPAPVPEITVYLGPDTSGQEIFNDQAVSVDFGSGPIGTNLFQTITVANTGTADLELVTTASDVPEISVLSGFPITVAAGADITIDLQLSGATAGSYNGLIVIGNNDSDEANFDIPVMGTIQTAQIALYQGADPSGSPVSNSSSTIVNIGQAQQGSTFTFTFAIENPGDLDLTISSITVDNPALTISSFPSSVPAGGFLVFTLDVDTSTPGTIAGLVQIVSQLGTFEFTVEAQVDPQNLTSEPFAVFNVVSPNGDGVHDYFKIQNIEAFPQNEIVIYNKQGNLVYETKGYDNANNNFTGRGNQGSFEELPTGTYYYILTLGDGSEVQKGFLVLNR